MDKLLEDHGQDLERDYVKSTYDAIAQDFSSTRYKKWPKVDAFLQSLSPHTLLLDVGCGNGKYLDNSQTINIGCDLSLNLLKICRTKGFEVVLCDMTRLPFRPDVFDSVICVAALHHISTAKRRQQCLSDIIGLLDPKESTCLVQVWSFEQQRETGNPYLSNQSNSPSTNDANSSIAKVLIADKVELPIHKNRTPFTEQDVLVPFHCKASHNQLGDQVKSGGRLRYYHVFHERELDCMFKEVSNVQILQSYYDKGNWCIVAGKGDAIAKGGARQIG